MDPRSLVATIESDCSWDASGVVYVELLASALVCTAITYSTYQWYIPGDYGGNQWVTEATIIGLGGRTASLSASAKYMTVARISIVPRVRAVMPL